MSIVQNMNYDTCDEVTEHPKVQNSPPASAIPKALNIVPVDSLLGVLRYGNISWDFSGDPMTRVSAVLHCAHQRTRLRYRERAGYRS